MLGSELLLSGRTAKLSSRGKMALVLLTWRHRLRLVHRWLHWWLLLRHCSLSRVVLMNLNIATCIQVLHWLCLPSVRSWAHELINLVLMRGKRVGDNWIVKSQGHDVCNVLRPVVDWLALLPRRWVLVGLCTFSGMVRSLIVRAVWFPHQVVVMANRNIFCALLVLLRVGLARAGSCIDEVVVGRVEAIAPV